ncbi:hypothetical protein MYCTH_2129407 [Thermothelomyces thermophilus ATCC 42464]|uniref:Uncharacterized protein n=1 Tax=Thermothelomyces thermophilus (strain ATCC 42464 / BCRC 31852 / DSM 1799) TaxID=573729 RepID=G2QIE1_THET4|nr:uncharacterized protein MYCTH_2129407 [Thermothelomyces thermophilus ATCC 42464]AEO60315.1 hypothetical protein MYCTH_2129407 [Thermothelomyces thermophilus ATCC 42464]
MGVGGSRRKGYERNAVSQETRAEEIERALDPGNKKRFVSVQSHPPTGGVSGADSPIPGSAERSFGRARNSPRPTTPDPCIGHPTTPPQQLCKCFATKQLSPEQAHGEESSAWIPRDIRGRPLSNGSTHSVV